MIEDNNKPLMSFNTNNNSKLKKVSGDLEIWKSIAVQLWKLLDDVDTAGDIFKPPINNFFKYVTKKSIERHKFLTTDGYDIFLTQKGIDNINSNKTFKKG